MSNFSNDKNDSENEDDRSNSDNNPDFLTALQEARNALDRLFHPIPAEEDKIDHSDKTHFERKNAFTDLNTTNDLKLNDSTDTQETHQSSTLSTLGSLYNKSNELLLNTKQKSGEFSSQQLRNNAVDQPKLSRVASKESSIINDDNKGIFCRTMGAKTSDNCQRNDSCSIREPNSKSGIDLAKVPKKSTTEKLNFLVEDLEVRLTALLKTNGRVEKDQPLLESAVPNSEEKIHSKVESFRTRGKNDFELPSSSISDRPSSCEENKDNKRLLLKAPRSLEESRTANIRNKDCNFASDYNINTSLSLGSGEFKLEQERFSSNKNTHMLKYLESLTSNIPSTGETEIKKEIGPKEDLKVDIPAKSSENRQGIKIAAPSTNYILLGDDTPENSSNLLKRNTDSLEEEKYVETKSTENKKNNIMNLSHNTVSNSLRNCTEEIINEKDINVNTQLHLPKYPQIPDDATSFKEKKRDVFPNSTPPNSLSLLSGNTHLSLPTVSLLPKYPQSHDGSKSLKEQNPEFLPGSRSHNSLSHSFGRTRSLLEPTVSNFEREIIPLRADSFENKNTKVPYLPKYPQAPDGALSLDTLNREFLSKSTPYNLHRYISGTTQSLLEPTISNLEREILLRGESLESKKTKVLQLPQTSIPNSPSSCEKEMVGDDSAKNRTHILCECDVSGMSGNAVPMVTSFTAPSAPNQKDNEKVVGSAVHNSASLSKVDGSQADNFLHKPKPSLIPKPTTTYPHKSGEKSNLPGRIPKQSCLLTSDQENSDEGGLPNCKIVTPSLPKKSINLLNEKPENSGKSKTDQQLRFNNESIDKQRRKKLQNEFSRNINRVVEEAVNLRKINNINGQSTVIDDLYRHIKELKTISNELSSGQSRDDNETNVSQEANDNPKLNVDSENRKSKDNNKIYIKFLPTKSAIKKRKLCNVEVQTDFTISSDDLQMDFTTEKISKHENILNDIDSMDGMFIPLGEEPRNMKEDDDEEGLDISITFPEFPEENLDQTGSHLSVCFSDISAEALGRLKRCPKEFTLHMDFVQGRMFFQSGKTPANNFSIGPNLKIIECNIDEKKSDIISIKPSTECMYNSQIIPVEGARTKSSVKILRSTDSELFNVVSIPALPNRRTSGNTKSCITFKNRGYASTGSLLSTRRSYKSMPQIPSLTNILEEPIPESTSTSRAAAMMNSDKKTKNRTLQKKRTNTSLEKLPEAH